MSEDALPPDMAAAFVFTEDKVPMTERVVFTIYGDGRVVIHDGATMDQCTRVFWEAVAKHAPPGRSLEITP